MGVALNLKKGMVLDLKKEDKALTNVIIGADWGKIETKSKWLFGFWGGEVTLSDVDLDLSVTLLDADKKEIDTVYFGHQSTKGIKHSGDDTSGDDEADDSDNEQIKINLGQLDSSTKYIVAHLVSFSGDSLNDLPFATARVYNADNSNEKMAEFKLTEMSDFKNKKGLLVGVFVKNDSNWSFKALGTPLDHKHPQRVASGLADKSIPFDA